MEESEPRLKENMKLLVSRMKEFAADRSKRVYIFLALMLVVVSVFAYILLLRAPSDFPIGQVISIQSGESLQTITTSLKNNHIISSGFIFRTAVILFGGEKKVSAGDYLFSSAEGPLIIAYRVSRGTFGLTPVKITIPEGWNIFQISDLVHKSIPHFDAVTFIALARSEEGYLFPDTYFISPLVSPAVLIETMKANFNEQKSSVPEIGTFGKSLQEVITMASILEGEARTTESRRMIADILWRRLSLGIPLQVDSTFSYINGKTSAELTVNDLKIDSPYNTYVYKGLPPTPISNPGLDSITAAVTPLHNSYMYFLSDTSGAMHYAVTFEEHKKNIAKYLK